MKHLSLNTLALAMAGSLVLAACGSDTDSSTPVPTYSKLTMTATGSYVHGGFDESAAEITAFHPETKQGFVVNAENKKVDVLDLTNPAKPTLKKSIDVSNYGADVNSVAIYGDILAAAVQADTKTDNGVIVFFNAQTLKFISKADVGALPDMVTFTPDGKTVLSANEGEPSDDYKTDPEGSVSIIDVSDINSPKVKTADFKAYIGKEAELNGKGIRIFGKDANAAQDIEPEYITVSDDGKTAFVSLQENNAIAIVDIATAKVTDIKSLGYKDHSKVGNELDPSNKDDKINLATWPVMGMYQPDAIASYSVSGKTYLVTANEGDSREYEYEDDSGEDVLAYTDETSVGKVELADNFTKDMCGNIDCDDKTALGKLKITNTMGQNADGKYETLYSYGARSFSIWDTTDMTQPVYDSGSDFAKLMQEKYPDNFNASNDDNSLDDRSDNKGAEPEGVVLGKVGNQTIAFIGLERISTVVAYDITDPTAPVKLADINTRSFDDDKMDAAEDGTDGALPNADGDLGPEGLTFISAEDSPNGKPLLLVGFEVSGSSRVIELDFAE